MRRVAWAAFFLLAGVLGAGCYGTGDVYLPTGAECAGFTSDEGPLCEGGVCLALIENEQGMDGTCSQSCNVEADCSPHEGCESIAEGTFCFRACNTDDDCYDAFVCRLIAIGNPRKYCLVDPL